MSDQKRQKQLRAGALMRRSAKSIAKKPPAKFSRTFVASWLKKRIPLALQYLGFVLFGLAIALAVAGVIIVATGSAGSLSRQIDYNLGADSNNVPYRPVTGYYNWMWAMIVNYYSYLLPLVYLVMIVVPVFIIYVVFSILHGLGVLVMRAPYSLSGEENSGVRLFATLAVWTLVVVLMWLAINADPVIHFLLLTVGLMVANLCLFGLSSWLAGRWGVSLDNTDDSDSDTESSDDANSNEPAYWTGNK